MKRIFILYGPSGGGKTTLANELKNIGVVELIGTTTRKPRDGEINGKYYHFVNEEEFNNMEFIEKTIYAGNQYGTSQKEIDNKFNQSDILFIILDINGLKNIKKIYGDIVKSIYVYCSYDTIKQRLIKRNVSNNEIEIRLNNLVDTKELDNIEYADYVIITGKNSLENCVKQLKFYIEMEQNNE